MLYKQAPVKFRSDPTKITAITAYMGSDFYSKSWNLGQGRYQHWGFQQQILRANVLSMQIEMLNLKENGFDMLKEISNVVFARLDTLKVEANNICTLESLQNLRMPLLRNLYVGNNNLTDVKSLRKVQWGQLHAIDFRCNFLVSVKELAALQAPNLAEIFLDTAIMHDVQAQSIEDFVKIQSNQISWIFAVSAFRIHSKGFKMVSNKKWQNCQLKLHAENRRHGAWVRNIIAW